MKKQQGTIFICEYCNKKSAHKHVIASHEKVCKKKPNNQHKCFQYCKHLEKFTTTEKLHSLVGGIIFDNFKEVVNFKCLKTNKLMYSYKLERNQKCNKDRIDKLERMPLHCENYECSGGVSGDYVFTE